MKLHVEKLQSNWILDKLNLGPTKENEGQYYILAPPRPILRTSSDYYIFDPKSREVILTMMCIRQRLFRNIDKSIFFKILTYIFQDGTLYLQNIPVFDEFVIKEPLIDQYLVPPADQPGVYCNWTPNDDGTAIVWDEGMQFYHYTRWMRYLINHFFIPWGITVNGDMEFIGQNKDDRGNITIVNNEIDIDYNDPESEYYDSYEDFN
jgi:hypothetical protein